MTFVNEGLTATSPMDVTNANANTGANVNVKVIFNDEIRRFAVPAPSTLVALEARARVLFSIAPESRLDLFYRDTDGDSVTMTSDEELQHAVQLSAGVLRLELRLKKVVAPSAPPAQPQPEQQPGMESPGPFGDFHGFHGAMRGMRGGMRGMPHGMRGAMMMRHHMMQHPQETPSEDFGGFTGFDRKFEHRMHHWKKWARHCHGDEDREGEIKDKLTARHVKDVTIPDGTNLAPKTPFVKTWRVRNEGIEWPAGSRLIFISKKGDHMSGPDFVPVQGPVLPNAEVDISVNLVAPDDLGLYTGVWRMCTAEGKKFGQRLWVSINVTSSSSSDEFEHVAAGSEMDGLVLKIQEMGFDIPRRKIERLAQKYAGNQDLVVEAVAKKVDKFNKFHEKVHGHHGHHGFPGFGRGGFEGRGGFGGFEGRGGFGGFEGRGGGFCGFGGRGGGSESFGGRGERGGCEGGRGGF